MYIVMYTPKLYVHLYLFFTGMGNVGMHHLLLLRKGKCIEKQQNSVLTICASNHGLSLVVVQYST